MSARFEVESSLLSEAHGPVHAVYQALLRDIRTGMSYHFTGATREAVKRAAVDKGREIRATEVFEYSFVCTRDQIGVL